MEVQHHHLAAVRVQAVDAGLASQEALGRTALNVGDLAAEDLLAVLQFQHRGDRVAMRLSCLQHGLAQADSLGRRVMDPPFFDFLAASRRLAGRCDRADFHADLAADALHPFPARYFLHDDFVATHVVQAQRVHRQIANRKTRHLRLGVGTAHGIGIHHRDAHLRGHQQRLQAVTTADLHAHHGAELSAEILLHHGHGARGRGWVVQALLADQRCTHVRHHGDEVVVVQVHRVHQRDTAAVGIELAHVQVVEVGAATAAGAQDPSAYGQRFDLALVNFVLHVS